jgi:hypothetical protein
LQSTWKDDRATILALTNSVVLTNFAVTVSTRSTITLLAGLFCLTLYNSTVANALNPTLNQQVEEVASFLEGTMDTSLQAAANPKSANVRMTTCRIALKSTQPAGIDGAIFLYQEQALSTDLTKPYRQRFIQLSPSPVSQTVRSLSFKPENPTVWSGFCNKPIADRVIERSSLGTPVCSVFLRRSGESYVGNTPVDGCPTSARGAIRITNHIVLDKAGMNTWDRGFDASGKQVWGAKAESYQFRRMKLESDRKE